MGRTFAWVLPFIVVLSRLSIAPSWQADLYNLRDLGLVGLGPYGGLSTALAQVARLIPLGSLPFRTAAIGAVFLAIVARLLYGIALAFLRSVEAERSAWLAPILAMVCALTTTLTPTYELESTACGGALVAIAGLFAVVSLSLRILARTTPRPATDTIALGALVGLTLAEDIACGALAILYLCGAYWIGKRRAKEGVALSIRALRAGALVGGLVAALFLAPFILRTATPRSLLDLGVIGSPHLAGLVEVTPSVGVFALLVREVGWIPLGLAAFGALLSLSARRVRRELAPLFVFAIADGLAPFVLPRRLLAIATFVTWDLAALAVLAIALVTGVHAAVSRLERIKLPLAKPAAVLVVVFQLVLVALIAEQAGDRADRGGHRAALEWTDAAFGDLPMASAVVAHTPALELRVLAAQLVEGARPDVLVVPVTLLGRGSVAADVASRERATEALIRTTSLAGTADEFALASLADRRHVYAELDPSWDRRTTLHFVPAAGLVAFSPEPATAQDRRTTFAATLPANSRLYASVAPDAPSDLESARLVRLVVKEEATALVHAGDLPMAAEAVTQARRAAGDAVIDLGCPEVASAYTEACLLDAEHAKARPQPKPRVADQPKRARKRRR